MIGAVIKTRQLMNSGNFARATVRPLIWLAVLAVAGCASMPVPSEQMAVAAAAVQRANTSGTGANAPGELQVALGKLASAQEAVARKDYARARQLAEQAEVDARVAELHAQSTRSVAAAQESQDAARALREEINRKTVR
jgi:hypothetical protein